MRLLLSLFFVIGFAKAKPDHWNQFRGPNGDGDAGNADLPVEFSEKKNLTWKAATPGKAWSSPVVRDGKVWITNAEEDGHKMWALQLDWETGKQLRKVLVFENKTPQFCHPMNSYATPTPVIEGGRVFVHFGSHGTAALEADTGKKIWERRDFKCDHWRGAAASPIPHKNTLIIHFDGHDLQYVVCLDQKTGKTIWKKDRAFDFKTDNGDRKKAYCTPSVIKHGDRLELISPAAVATESRNPENGELFWTASTGGMNASSRPIYRHGMVYVFSGMGSMSAIKPGGEGNVDQTHLVWNRRKVVPKKSSPLLLGDYLFMVSDEGVASCNDPKTGEVLWAERLGVKGECASSPIHANGKIYSFSISGDCVVFEPNPEGLKILASNKLDDGCMASPAVVGDSLLVRTKQNLYRFDRPQSTSEKSVQPVFNGKDLTGWKVPKGNDKANWYQVIDGVLQIRSGPKKKGSVLWTEKSFRDFEMEFDFRFGEGTVDSGVHLRTQDQIQIGISGSLKRDMTCSPYIPGKGYPVEAKDVAKLLKAKDWNHMKIRAIGHKYTVWLQGKEVMNYESSSAKPEGPVGIQLHGNRNMGIDYKDIVLKEL